MRGRNRSLFIVFAATLVTVWTAGDPGAPVSADEPTEVSLVQLIANGTEWHGKLIRVDGYCRFEFEETVLYLHQEDAVHLMSRNGVWLRLGWPVPEKYRPVTEGYALVEGVFDAHERGHLGLFSGEIKDVVESNAFAVERKGPLRPGNWVAPSERAARQWTEADGRAMGCQARGRRLLPVFDGPWRKL